MRSVKNIIKFSIVSMLIVMLSSCTSVNRRVGAVLDLDTDVKMEFSIDEFVNPDEQDQSSPVFVRLYELKDTTQFESADFIDLYERDKEVLGKSFIARQELKPFVPGSVREESFVLDKETQYIGLFVEFFQYKDSTSTLVFPITTTNVVRNLVRIRILDNKIELDTRPKTSKKRLRNN